MMKASTSAVIDRTIRPIEAAVAAPAIESWARSRAAERRETRPATLEAVLTLAYDTRRRTYVLIRGSNGSRVTQDIDEATALAITDRLELGAKRKGLPRALYAGGEPDLHPKEVLVLQAIADGLTNRAIASKLRITENTVKRHNQHIYAKLGLQSRTQAVLVGLERGWITTGS